MAGDLIDQLTSDPDFLSLSEADQDAMYEELSGKRAVVKGTFGDIPAEAYARGERNIAGNILERPAAAMRSLLQGKGYTAGAINPTGVKRFQDLALDTYYRDVPDFPGKGAVGNVVSAGGLAADIVTDPAAVLGLLMGKLPLGAGRTLGQTVATSPVGQAVKRVATTPIRPIQAMKSATEQAVMRPATKAIDFLRGSPKRIDKLKQSTHEFILNLRRGGSQHDELIQQMDAVADQAWAPMKELARSVDEPTTLNEVFTELNRMYPEDPLRAREAMTLLRQTVKDLRSNVGTGRVGDTAGILKEFNGPELEQLSSTIGKVVPKGVRQGKIPPAQAHVFRNDVRTAISNILESKAPTELQGNARLAKDQWAGWKADQQKLYDIFAPNAPKEAETKYGVEFVQRAGRGDITKSEQDFLGRLQQNFPKLYEQFSQQLGKSATLTQRSKIGKVAGIAGTGYLISKTSPGQAILRALLGRNQ